MSNYFFMQVQDVAQNDFEFRSVTVHATLLPLVDGTDPKQFGQWDSISDAHGIAMFSNLDVASKGQYKIRFWLDILNSSSVTTSTFTGMWQKYVDEGYLGEAAIGFIFTVRACKIIFINSPKLKL